MSTKRLDGLTRQLDQDEKRALCRRLVREGFYDTGNGELVYQVVLVRKGMPDFYFARTTTKRTWVEKRGRIYFAYTDAHRRAVLETRRRVREVKVAEKHPIPVNWVRWHVEVRAMRLQAQTSFRISPNAEAIVELVDNTMEELRLLVTGR